MGKAGKQVRGKWVSGRAVRRDARSGSSSRESERDRGTAYPPTRLPSIFPTNPTAEPLLNAESTRTRTVRPDHPSSPSREDPPADLAWRSINAIRALAMDAVEQAQSGHPGTPMALAPATYVLWTRFLRHNPRNPQWADRDQIGRAHV